MEEAEQGKEMRLGAGAPGGTAERGTVRAEGQGRDRTHVLLQQEAEEAQNVSRGSSDIGVSEALSSLDTRPQSKQEGRLSTSKCS